MKVAVVHDLRMNDEEKLMIDSVSNALKKVVETEKLVVDDNFIKKVKKFDFVFNLSSRGGKETRQIFVPSILDILEIPYSSSNAYVHSVCMQKEITKLVLKHNNIPVPDFFDPKTYDGKKKFFIKPSKEGSAKGISKDSVAVGIDQIKKLKSFIKEKYHQTALIEEFIDGKELSVGIIGNNDKIEVLPILEIDFSNLPKNMEKFYSYRVKHHYGKETNYICPTNLDIKTKETIERYSVEAFKALNLRDYARIDIRLKENVPYFIEINSMPQLVPKYSDITKMAKAAGYNYNDFILKIFKVSLKRYGITLN